MDVEMYIDEGTPEPLINGLDVWMKATFPDKGAASMFLWSGEYIINADNKHRDAIEAYLKSQGIGYDITTWNI